MPELDFERVVHLFNPEVVGDLKVTLVGVGSGGAPVCDHLTMNGIRRWSLFDPDSLEAVNLVKHPRSRRHLGLPKVDIQADWIRDRNPSAVVSTFQEDVMLSDAFPLEVQDSHLVLSCSDRNDVREFVNDICVASGVASVTASVFRTGIGGEVFSYIPGETGCYRCLQHYALLNNVNLTDDALGLTVDEEERIYGLGEKNFRASGLSLDIQSVALIQARLALSILLLGRKSALPRMRANWIIWGNRPAPGVFTHHFEARQMLLRPQSSCNCSRRGATHG